MAPPKRSSGAVRLSVARAGPYRSGPSAHGGDRSGQERSRASSVEKRTSWVHPDLPTPHKETSVIILGLILLIIGIVAGISLLTTIGTILIIVGAVLWILGATGRA